MTLQRIVLPPRRRLRVAVSATVAVIAMAGAAAILHERPRPPVVAVLAPPPVVIAVAVPPAPPPVAPLVKAAPAPHVGCTADDATIGIPLARSHVAEGAPPIKDLSVSREGCTIAILVRAQLSVSWDGGASFTVVDAGVFDEMVAVDGAVRLLRAGKELGTVGPGTIAWHPIPPALAASTLLAAGRLTALAGDGLVAVTDNDGASWSYVEVPKRVALTSLDASGHLLGERTIEAPDGEGILDFKATLFEADVGLPRWHRTGTRIGARADELGRYVTRSDRFWGCGGTTKVVTRDGALVAADIRDDFTPIAIHSNARATFATLRERLVQLFGASDVDIAEMPEGELVAVDATGLPIVRAQTRVLRWSRLGGWRVLFATQP